jgi:hypothetical protein
MNHSDDLISRYRRLFLAGCPDTHSQMQPPGAAAKYIKRFHPLTNRELAAHLAGKATFAASLIGSDGFTWEVALDIDAGGEEAISTGLRIAASFGFTAIGLVSRAGEHGHDGGHIRMPLADIASPERARLLAKQVKAELVLQCGLAACTIETYPTRKGLRLPFGVHTWTGRRGLLLLQDGTGLDLDNGEARVTIEHAICLAETVCPNDPARLPLPAPKPIYNAPVDSPHASGRTNGGSPIQDISNQQTCSIGWFPLAGASCTGLPRAGIF